MSAALDQEVIWAPTVRQEAFLACDDFEVLYGGAAGGGKALDLLTPIPTPEGWKKMADIRPGDRVFDENGDVCIVLATSEIMSNRPCYRVEFSDGSYIVADEEHLWPTMTIADRQSALRRTPEYRERRKAARARRGSGKRNDLAAMNAARPYELLAAPAPMAKTTGEIRETLKVGKAGRLNHSIAVAGALDLPDADLLVDPYILGAWLGDGKTTAGSFTTADVEMVEAFREHYQVTKQSGNYAYGTIGLATHLRAIGVLGYKHIPDAYLRASKRQRLSLLQGLMDTDGYCDARGQCEFTTTSIELAVGMRELITSLGIKVALCTGRATLNGRDISEKYRLKFQTELPAFRLERKLGRQKREGFRGTHDVRYIVSVDRVPSRPVKCIKVSSASHCYLAGKEMIPTHNSDALLIDALCLQHDGPSNPNHRAVLFRRSFPELRDLIDRSLELYPQIIDGCTEKNYNQTEKVWTFPGGARVEFGYLQHDNDRLKYRGRAWNYIGFDELTLWATPVCYLYLFSRCRSADRTLPRYIRSTTNPDGPGQKWVMQRWGIQEDGAETNIPVDIADEEQGIVTTMRRRFIPARLSDNPHLGGTGYREALLQLDPEEREALLKGLWKGSKVKGAYYLNEMQKLRAEGRIRRVPYTPGSPVNTFWDLGFNDTTAIWFHQYVAGEHRFIHAYENSGESLDHFAAYLLARGYVFGTHYLPHDAQNKSLQTGKSAKELLEGMLPGHHFEVVPRVEAVLTGIQQTRMKMVSNVYIDETECADGIAALDNYRKKYNEKMDVYTEQPLHDRFSNYADAFRQWGQGYEITNRGPSLSSVRRTRSWRTA